MIDCQDIAVYIVQTIKTIGEAVMNDIKNEKTFEELFPNYDATFEMDKMKEFRKFDLKLFDDTEKYYKDLIQYFKYHLSRFYSRQKLTLFKFKSSFTTIYFSLLTDLLLHILRNNKESYSDDIIKCDITALTEILADKSKRLIFSDTFFLNCVNELIGKYDMKVIFDCVLKKNDFIRKMDIYYKDQATIKLNQIKSKLSLYIKCGFDDYISKIIIPDIKEMNEDELDKYSIKIKKCKDSFEAFKNKIKNLSDVNQLKSICSNEDIKNNLCEYSKIISKKLFKTETEFEKVLENFVLPLKILDIELNVENSRIIYNINYNSNIFPENYQLYEDFFYLQFLEKKKEIEFTKKKNYYNEINDLIQDNQFLNDFYEILKTQNISFFLCSKRIYDDNNFCNVIFVSEQYKSDEAQFLKAQYEQFLKDIKCNNFDALKKLLRIKVLAYDIPALTGPSMKIFINPILDFSDIAKKDDKQRKNILKAALKILLIHEVSHLLKFYPIENVYPKETPSTPKGRENGQCLIFYLFGKSVIKNISNEQALLINDIKVWDNLETLKDIFKEEKKKTNYNVGELDLCITTKEKTKFTIKEKTDYCFWE